METITVKFLANDSYLEIDPTITIWCKCWVVLGDNKSYLGAESLKYVKDHLAVGLDDTPKNSSGQLHGYDFSWVLSLSEVHSSLYVAQDAQGKVLLWQDANAKDIALMRLSQEQILEWRKQIAAM